MSIIPPRYIPNTPHIQLDQPVAVSGFRGSKSVDVHLQVNVGVSFRPGVIRAKYFIVDVPHAILVNDVLRDKEKTLSLQKTRPTSLALNTNGAKRWESTNTDMRLADLPAVLLG